MLTNFSVFKRKHLNLMARESWKPWKSKTKSCTRAPQSRKKIDNSLRSKAPRKRNKRITMIIARIAGSHEIPREIIHENGISEKTCWIFMSSWTDAHSKPLQRVYYLRNLLQSCSKLFICKFRLRQSLLGSEKWWKDLLFYFHSSYISDIFFSSVECFL